MAVESYANSAQTTLAVAAGTAAQGASGTITVASAATFPSSGQYRISIDQEIMIVTGGQGSITWTVTRGSEGTIGAAHLVNATITHVLTAAGLQNVTLGADLAVRSITVSANSPYTPTAVPGGEDFSAAVRIAGGKPWVDVTHPTYGAKGDNFTDDTAAFNAAIAAAALTGSAVLVPPAIQGGFGSAYMISGVISNANNVPLICIGEVMFAGTGKPINLLRLGTVVALYVASAGSDSNIGLSVGTAFLTIQHAVNVAATFAGLGQQILIRIASGTYAGCSLYSNGVSFNPSPTGLNGITLVGGWGGGTTTITKGPGLACVQCFGPGALINISTGITFTSTNTAIYAQQGGCITIQGGCTFGACTGEHMHADFGGLIFIYGSYTISGNATDHFGFSFSGQIIFAETAITVTLTGSPVFSIAFAYVQHQSMLYVPSSFVTFSGSAGAVTARFLIAKAGQIETVSGAADSYLPGTAPGQISGTGRYYPDQVPVLSALSAGFGGGGPSAVAYGSNQQGVVVISTGTAPGASGTMTMTFRMTGQFSGGPHPISFSTSQGTWNTRAIITMTAYTATTLTLNIDNNGVNFPASSSLYFNYITMPF